MTLAMQRTEQTTGRAAGGRRSSGHGLECAQHAGAARLSAARPRRRQIAKTESGTYGVSKTVRHMVENPGRVRRLTAAIVVNDRLIAAGEQESCRGVAAALGRRAAQPDRAGPGGGGFDTTRGDVLTVEDLAFDDNRPQPPAPRFRSRSLNDCGEFAGAGEVCGAAAWACWWWWPSACGPRMRRAGAALAAAGSAKGSAGSCLAAAAAPAALAPAGAGRSSIRSGMRTQEIFEQVTTHLKREPTQSSRLLQSWIHSD